MSSRKKHILYRGFIFQNRNREVHRDQDEKIKIISNKDGFNKNRIEQTEQDAAIQNAQTKMIKQVNANQTLLVAAENKAKESIRNQIEMIGNQRGIKYEIEWEYIEENKKTED